MAVPSGFTRHCGRSLGMECVLNHIFWHFFELINRPNEGCWKSKLINVLFLFFSNINDDWKVHVNVYHHVLVVGSPYFGCRVSSDRRQRNIRRIK